MNAARLKDIRRKIRQTRPTNEEVCCEECANELNETVYEVSEAEYQGKSVTLNKPLELMTVSMIIVFMSKMKRVMLLKSVTAMLQ